MPEIDERIDALQVRLENLIKSQELFYREIGQIRYEINVLRVVQQKRSVNPQAETAAEPPVREYVPPPKTTLPEKETIGQTRQNYRQTSDNQWNEKRQNTAYQQPPRSQTKENQAYQPTFTESSSKSNLEKFIGENLISKIGIVILVIGIAIGAKYAIDNNLISPLGRIIIGYAFGFGLLGFAVKLKAKYLNFSAVLLSGGMAIMYFITYFAYSFYSLISQPSAFVLMLIFTAFTVASAINYNRQIIAHLGLVGAYAIPFLLSNNSGRYDILFGYTAIINIGILAVSLKKYWKPVFYTSFIFTWATFSGWYITEYKTAEHFSLALFFAAVFFLIFYLTFLGYKLLSRENVAIENVALVLANSFIFYGIGYSILDNRAGFEDYLGLFTVINAGIHFAFAVTVSRMKLGTQDLIYLLAALVLTFITIAVPVQLDGNVITLVWAAEAGILFWVGRTKQITLYEVYSYPLMLLATISLLNDWQIMYRRYFTSEIALMPFANPFFATAIFFVVAFAFIYFVNRDKKYATTAPEPLGDIAKYAIAAVLLFALYNTFRIEIGNYYHFRAVGTAITDLSSQNTPLLNGDLFLFNIVWQINYTMFFLMLLTFANFKKLKDPVLGFVNLGLNLLILVLFMTAGLYAIGELRESYLSASPEALFPRSVFHILIRYFSYVFLGGLIYSIYQYFKQEFIADLLSERDKQMGFDFILYVSILCVASSELINWMDIFGYNDSYKLGLSILWGVYALILIVLGIYQHKKHLRIGAIALFAVTLIKLFFYDIAELDTISKTVVFVSLGILLLIVSFLYNKYKNLIFETE